MSYFGWNVHSYGPAWTKTIQEIRASPSPPDMWSPVDNDVATHLFEVIAEHYRADQKVFGVLTKMSMRYREDIGGYFDPELAGVNAIRLLMLAWKAVTESDDQSVYDGFREMLHDIGDTCVQGDTFRLFVYWWALTGSSQ